MWHRIETETEVEDFIRAGWTNFTLRPYGSTEWIYVDVKLMEKELAQLCLHGFGIRRPPNPYIFRDLMTGARLGQACVPGPLSAHEQAMLAAARV